MPDLQSRHVLNLINRIISRLILQLYAVANTLRNATTARATDSGLDVKEALPGVPFPIPADGSEVMWNHRLRYMGSAFEFRYENWLVPPATEPVLAGAG